jgi:hypothetical protein
VKQHSIHPSSNGNVGHEHKACGRVTALDRQPLRPGVEGTALLKAPAPIKLKLGAFCLRSPVKHVFQLYRNVDNRDLKREPNVERGSWPQANPAPLRTGFHCGIRFEHHQPSNWVAPFTEDQFNKELQNCNKSFTSKFSLPFQPPGAHRLFLNLTTRVCRFENPALSNATLVGTMKSRNSKPLANGHQPKGAIEIDIVEHQGGHPM